MPLETAGGLSMMRAMLQERFDAARMGLVFLCQDAIEELRCLIHGGNEMVRLKAIELALGVMSKSVSALPAQSGITGRHTARGKSETGVFEVRRPSAQR